MRGEFQVLNVFSSKVSFFYCFLKHQRFCVKFEKISGIKHKQSGDGWNGPLGTIASHTIKLIRENITKMIFRRENSVEMERVRSSLFREVAFLLGNVRGKCQRDWIFRT